ncbi:hypothetical protein SAMN04488689_107161 [Paenibacillus sp. cl6col]|uniref:Uncharacterized protein n=1 Tax=Paenibacillus alvei TaxID=44250 RepID=A0ABT4E8R6_PAEAL|nr:MULTISPECIES: hypothetical protein [Paenibacillus]MCY9529460.1 hypothetical protein [Paenibacillus alvei]SDF83416.1 hypothetical protein SAMN04488689_107161 [Paenibacillus sp. cl6col]
MDQPTTGNEIVDKIADFTGGAAGLVVNPGGVGTSTQNLFTTTNKMATSLAAAKGGQIVQNTMSKSLEKVLNPKYAGAAQRVTQYTLNGAVAGSLHSTSLSLIQNKSSGKELLEAALWGGAFGALGGMLSPMLGKVFTAARQYTSKLKPNQIIANLKQSMKQKVVTGNPLAANPIRKGLETKGYRPKPGEANNHERAV